MRRIVYSVAASLDAYIAGPNGEYDWIVMDPEIDFKALYQRFDTVLMGRRSYDIAGGGSMSGMRTVVASRTLKPADHPRVTILGDDLVPALTRMKAESGKDIWLWGGGDLFRSLLDAKLVDVVGVAIIPVLIGGGIPLLPPRIERARLKLTEHKVFGNSGIVALEYAVEYGPAPKAKRKKRK